MKGTHMTIYIWGCGRLTGKILGRYIALEDVEGFIDNNITIKEYMGKKVFTPNEIVGREYDAIIVANLYSREIYEQCRSMNYDLKKMIFVYSNCYMRDLNTDYKFIEKVLGTECADAIKNRYHIVRDLDINDSLVFDSLDSKKYKYIETDWVRIKTFELTIKEIKKANLKGSVAELGVFKGEFAQFINQAFPNDRLYLFDTFEGFDVEEAKNELKSGNCTESFIKAYENTTISYVMSKMQYAENVSIVKGLFPESLNGLEDKFKFVSIDCDFEESIYEGLKYFYPRLVKGGYLFVHDYSSALLGVERAIIKFEREFGKVCKVPLCDANGTLIITK